MSDAYREDHTSLSPSQEGELAHQMLGQMGIRVVSEADYAAMPQAPVAPAIKPVASRYTIIVPLKGKKAIAFNSRSHNFVIFGPKELKRWKKLEEGGYANLSHPDLMVFAHLGFVVPEGTNELDLVRQEYWHHRNDKSSMGITIAPTLGCNMACSYCFQGLDKPTKKMTAEVLDKLVEFTERRMEGVNHLNITWYGGEPLMDKKAIYALSDRFMAMCAARGAQYSASIVTNGFLLDRTCAEELAKRNVSTVQITIDGYGEAHDKARPLTSGKGSYERILAHIASFIDDVPLSIAIRVNVTVENAPVLQRMLEDFVARGLAGKRNFSVYFAPVEAATAETETVEAAMLGKVAYAKVELELTRYAIAHKLTTAPRAPSYMGLCVAPRENGFVVAPNGELHKCWDTIQNTRKKVGTIFDDASLFQTDESKMWQAWDPFDNPVCSSCKIAPMCAGFCQHKFLYPEETRGEMGALPCPPWKFNVGEYLFLRAEEAKLVKRADWDDEQATHLKWHGGFRHTRDSMEGANATVKERVTRGDFGAPKQSCDAGGCGCKTGTSCAPEVSVMAHPTASCG